MTSRTAAAQQAAGTSAAFQTGAVRDAKQGRQARGIGQQEDSSQPVLWSKEQDEEGRVIWQHDGDPQKGDKYQYVTTDQLDANGQPSGTVRVKLGDNHYLYSVPNKEKPDQPYEVELKNGKAKATAGGKSVPVELEGDHIKLTDSSGNPVQVHKTMLQSQPSAQPASGIGGIFRGKSKKAQAPRPVSVKDQIEATLGKGPEAKELARYHREVSKKLHPAEQDLVDKVFTDAAAKSKQTGLPAKVHAMIGLRDAVDHGHVENPSEHLQQHAVASKVALADIGTHYAWGEQGSLTNLWHAYGKAPRPEREMMKNKYQEFIDSKDPNPNLSFAQWAREHSTDKNVQDAANSYIQARNQRTSFKQAAGQTTPPADMSQSASESRSSASPPPPGGGSGEGAPPEGPPSGPTGPTGEVPPSGPDAAGSTPPGQWADFIRMGKAMGHIQPGVPDNPTPGELKALQAYGVLPPHLPGSPEERRAQAEQTAQMQQMYQGLGMTVPGMGIPGMGIPGTMGPTVPPQGGGVGGWISRHPLLTMGGAMAASSILPMLPLLLMGGGAFGGGLGSMLPLLMLGGLGGGGMMLPLLMMMGSMGTGTMGMLPLMMGGGNLMSSIPLMMAGDMGTNMLLGQTIMRM